jgi:23S rRNA pseudouridine1911/1915/1917 synthase
MTFSLKKGMMPHMKTAHTITVNEETLGKRLDKILSEALPDMSRSFIQKLIKDGHASFKGTALTQPSAKVKDMGDLILSIPEATPLDVISEDIPLEILFEDDQMLMLNKPAGISVHPSDSEPSGTLVNALLYHCKGLSGIGGVERPGIVHRLDKGTSGTLVIAKSDIAHHSLSKQFANRTTERFYLALCYGNVPNKQGTIETLIGRHPGNRKKMAVLQSGGKTAISTYTKLATSECGTFSLLKFKLHTGRTHQIRVHAHHIGHPIVGDPVYGSPKSLKGTHEEVKNLVKSLDHQMLHAAYLGVFHPITFEKIITKSPVPEDYSALLEAISITQPTDF